MVRPRRYRQRLFAPTLVLAAVIEGGGALAYQAFKPVPPPPPFVLAIEIGGKGSGTVIAGLIGDDRPLATCSATASRCRIEVPRDRYVTLTAVRGEKMTFEGWQGCEPHGENVLACDVMMFRDRAVSLGFGNLADDVEVAWVETVPDAAIALPTLPKPDPLAPEKLEEEPPVELALAKPPEPAPLLPPLTPPPPPPPPPAEAAPPPPPLPANLRMVEVPDENQVEKAPDDATHLSDKNRDVAEETAAAETNLEKESKGEQPPSAESDDTTSPDVGGPEHEIAQLEHAESEWNELDRSSDHSGTDDTATGQVTGEAGDDGDEGTGGDRDPGLLAMRGIGGRGQLLDNERGDGKARGAKGAPGLHKQLDLDDYERIVGTDAAEQERTLARAKMSAKAGRWERKLAAIKSSLENFTPDVRSGNQTALKTRAHPFAVYVARMHRRIHELWGFGFLDDLDGKSSNHPLNDFDLVSVIELSINPDGTVFKSTIARTSGKLEFDVAALDTVLSAAPYQPTPEAIRSVDGRVYLRWGFHRNWKQCGTFNVEPYILTSIPGGAQPLDDGAALSAAIPKREAKTGGAPVTPPPAHDEPRPAPASPDRAANYAANMWVAGFASASTARMVRVSAVPFSAGGDAAAQTTKELESIYEGLLVESGALKDWKLLTAGEYQRKNGPGRGIAGDALVIAMVTSKARFGVVLTPTRSGEYRATQILR